MLALLEVSASFFAVVMVVAVNEKEAKRTQQVACVACNTLAA